MTKAEAKKQILGVFLSQIDADDEALFGDDVVDAGEDSKLFKAFDAARAELREEFRKRTT